MAGRCSMWSTTAHPSTFSHRRALCMLTSTCTSGAAVNPKREILHVCRGKGLPKNFWMEGVSQFRERASHSPFGWMFSRTQTKAKSSASATGDIKYESKRKSLELQQIDPASIWAHTSEGPYLAPGLPGLSQRPANESDPTYWLLQTLENLISWSEVPLTRFSPCWCGSWQW